MKPEKSNACKNIFITAEKFREFEAAEGKTPIFDEIILPNISLS